MKHSLDIAVIRKNQHNMQGDGFCAWLKPAQRSVGTTGTRHVRQYNENPNAKLRLWSSLTRDTQKRKQRKYNEDFTVMSSFDA